MSGVCVRRVGSLASGACTRVGYAGDRLGSLGSLFVLAITGTAHGAVGRTKRSVE
jgi:hypothetical protein